MGGEEIIKRLKEIDLEVKAIVSRGYSDSSVRANYKKYGFSAVVRKPYKIQELKAVLESVQAF